MAERRVSACITHKVQPMKTRYFVIVIAVILGGIAYKFVPTKVEFKQGETQVIEKKVEVDALDQAIKSKQDEKKQEIETIAEKARQDTYNQEMKKVELQVIQDFNKKLNTRQEELEKQVSLGQSLLN